MEAAFSLLINEFSAPLWSLQIGCNSIAKITAIMAASSEDGLLIGQFLAGVPNQAANHSQDHSQFRRWLADWPVSGWSS